MATSLTHTHTHIHTHNTAHTWSWLGLVAVVGPRQHFVVHARVTLDAPDATTAERRALLASDKRGDALGDRVQIGLVDGPRHHPQEMDVDLFLRLRRPVNLRGRLQAKVLPPRVLRDLRRLVTPEAVAEAALAVERGEGLATEREEVLSPPFEEVPDIQPVLQVVAELWVGEKHPDELILDDFALLALVGVTEGPQDEADGTARHADPSFLLGICREIDVLEILLVPNVTRNLGLRNGMGVGSRERRHWRARADCVCLDGETGSAVLYGQARSCREMLG